MTTRTETSVVGTGPKASLKNRRAKRGSKVYEPRGWDDEHHYSLAYEVANEAKYRVDRLSEQLSEVLLEIGALRKMLRQHCYNEWTR